MNLIWKNPTWPNFTFSTNKVVDLERQFLSLSATLSGQVSMLSNDSQYDTLIELMMSEAISTSAIEGEQLDRESVRSSLKNYLGLSKPFTKIKNAKEENVAYLMVQVRKSLSSPLSHQLLFDWHKLIIQQTLYQKPFVIGDYRNSQEPMVIASGPIGYEKVHYEAPPSSILSVEMDKFLKWYNGQETTHFTLIKASIAHLWFECLHPFDDGNGRIGRAIAEHAIGQTLGYPPLLSLSSVIEKNKSDYYENLNKASYGDLNVDTWIQYFSNTIVESQKEAMLKVSHILDKSRFWTLNENKVINERQRKVILKIFDAGHAGYESGINARKYQSIAKCSKATATRDLADLLAKEMITRLPGSGRNTRYCIHIPAKNGIE